MKNSSYYIAPVGDRTHDLPHTVDSIMVKVSHALNHSATAAVSINLQPLDNWHATLIACGYWSHSLQLFMLSRNMLVTNVNIHQSFHIETEKMAATRGKTCSFQDQLYISTVGSIQSYYNYCMKNIHSYISTSVSDSQIFIFTAE